MRLVRQPLRALAALTLVAFALTGCMKVDMNVTVNTDDTLDGTMIVAVDKSMLALSGKSPEDAFKNAKEISDLPEGSRAEAYDDGKYYGQKIIYDNLPFTAFNSGKKGAPAITHNDGRYTFSADMNTAGSNLGPQAQLAAPLLSSIKIKFVITFPGKVIEHDESAIVSGNTVTWNVRLGEDNKLRAVAEEGSTFPWLVVAVVGGGLGLLVIAGIVLLALWLRRPTPAPALAGDQPIEYPPATPTSSTEYPPTAAYPTIDSPDPHWQRPTDPQQ